MPVYRNASPAGESVVLKNPGLRLELYKRLTGWGWGEMFDGNGRCVAVLEHLGEVLLRDQEIPMRLEAAEYRRESGEFGERLIFPVRSAVVREKLRGTSFANWVHYPLDAPILEGVHL